MAEREVSIDDLRGILTETELGYWMNKQQGVIAAITRSQGKYYVVTSTLGGQQLQSNGKTLGKELTEDATSGFEDSPDYFQNQ